jgi:hypothetical protein
VTYQFIREDNGEVVEVDFEAMMEKDAMGCITLPDGVMARERRPSSRRQAKGNTNGVEQEIISDGLGFSELQLAEFEADRKAHGFSGVEFKRDPLEPTYYRVHFSGRREWERYIKHRGAFNKNGSRMGVTLAPGELERAAKRVREG